MLMIEIVPVRGDSSVAGASVSAAGVDVAAGSAAAGCVCAVSCLPDAQPASIAPSITTHSSMQISFIAMVFFMFLFSCSCFFSTGSCLLALL